MSVRLRRQIGYTLGLASAGLAVLWVVFAGNGHITTDNAYVKADKLSLATEVPGLIEVVAVEANQSVRRGDLLVKLNARPYMLEVAEARAHIAQARNEIEARRAEFAEAAAEVAKAQDDVAYYSRKLARAERLGSLAVSESDVDEARQALKGADAPISINEQRLLRLRAELGGDPHMPIEEQADLLFAQAELESALYKVSRTELRAPQDGIIANDVPQVGEMAITGMTLISMLGTDEVWIEANLKETQLAGVRQGMPATVTIDAYPDLKLTAEVASLSPASGSEFALIPAQNASGNWVKVIQRVPVRLRVTLPQEGPILRAGMSAAVDISIDAGSKKPPDSLAQGSSEATEKLVATAP